MLFEPVRKTQDAMFFIKNSNNVWVPCGPRQPGAVQTTMQELAEQGLASQVWVCLGTSFCVNSYDLDLTLQLIPRLQIIPPPITRTDFDKVLAKQKPTVSTTDLQVHERFTKEFGEEG